MSSKRYPGTGYDAKYPTNQKFVSESGHEVEFDNTPGAERIRVSHKSGSHREYWANGHVTDVTVAGHTQYVKGGLTQTVDDNVDAKVGGSSRSSIHGDRHTEVAGHDTSLTQGDHREIVGGDHASAVGGDCAIGVTGKTTLKVGGGLELKGDQALNMKVDANGVVQFGKDLLIESLTSITLKVGDSTITMTPGNITLKSARIDLNP